MGVQKPKTSQLFDVNAWIILPCTDVIHMVDLDDEEIEVLATSSILLIVILILGSVLSHSFLFTSSSPSNGNSGDDKSAKVSIGDIDYVFDPETVESLRSDLFKSDHFSIFDVLVHLERLGEIELTYHFDSSMNTQVIDSLNGEDGWWYEVYYDGGWPENNVYRMDNYLWKEVTSNFTGYAYSSKY